jgi:hypothetical protein
MGALSYGDPTWTMKKEAYASCPGYKKYYDEWTAVKAQFMAIGWPRWTPTAVNLQKKASELERAGRLEWSRCQAGGTTPDTSSNTYTPTITQQTPTSGTPSPTGQDFTPGPPASDFQEKPVSTGVPTPLIVGGIAAAVLVVGGGIYLYTTR